MADGSNDAASPDAEVEARPTVTFDSTARLQTDGSTKRPTPTRFRAGDLIPGTRYRIRRWLGWGGMGSVFEAVNEDTERRVAVKILHEQYIARSEVTRAFRNEARVTGRLEAQNLASDHIVEVYDRVSLADGRELIAMEFLDGRDLYEETRAGPLSMSRVVAIGRQIAQGMGAAHRAGIIHRDLKPANVMLIRRRGRHDFVKVLDFGVARLLADETTSRGGGTPMYLAPEALSQVGDHRVDIYALGCLLFELATGNPPYDGTNEELVSAHRDAPIPRASTKAAAGVPASFDRFIARCMAKRPEDRIQSMMELEAQLCELQIEQRWTTVWDDLPAPEVEPARRARIAEALAPKRTSTRSFRGPMLAATAGLVLAIGIITWASLPDPSPAIETPVDEVETLSLAARAAAARAYFVYPAVDDHNGSTAYREVLALEAIDNDRARERSAALRDEFSATLTRLGDRYWIYEEARSFSHEYYAMAALFVPTSRALARAGVTPTALDRLRDKAARGDFTEYELASVLPLAALATDDPEARDELLREAARRSPSARGVAELDRLIAAVAPTLATESASPPSPPPTAASPTPDAPEQDPLPMADAPVAAVSAPSDDLSADGHGNDDRPRTVAPEELENWMQLANGARRAGRERDAESLYLRILGEHPRHVDALDALGDLYFSAARYAESLRFRRRATSAHPRSAHRWLALGDAYFKTLDYEKARSAYLRAEDLGSPAAHARVEKVASKLAQ